MKFRKSILVILLFLSFNGLFAVSERRVLIMDIKNISGDANYAYLEPSITEAVIKTLKKTFVFILFEEKEWKALAKKNFFFEDSFHTPTIGMQMGLFGRQDIVIGGGYTIKGNKIIAKIHILGVGEKKVLKAFEVEGYADNRIWESVQLIADTIATTAKDVLPNKEEWSSYSVQGRNQITLSGNISPISMPAAIKDPLPSGTAFSISPNDFTLVYKFSFDYMRIGLLFDNFGLWGNFSYSMADAHFPASGHTPINTTENTVTGKLTAYQAMVGIGYRLFNIKSFYVFPRIGGGFYFNDITLDFTTLNNVPSALTTNTDLTVVSGQMTGITANAQLILGYQLLEWMTAEFMTEYQHIFFNNEKYAANVFFTINLGIKF